MRYPPVKDVFRGFQVPKIYDTYNGCDYNRKKATDLPMSRISVKYDVRPKKKKTQVLYFYFS